MLTAIGCAAWAAALIFAGLLAGAAWIGIDAALSKALLLATALGLLVLLARRLSDTRRRRDPDRRNYREGDVARGRPSPDVHADRLAAPRPSIGPGLTRRNPRYAPDSRRCERTET